MAGSRSVDVEFYYDFIMALIFLLSNLVVFFSVQ